MARIRSIKPETWTDEKFVSLSPLARLLFIGMWNFADDEGRMVYSPTRIKLQVLPADSADISALIGEILRESLIQIYEVDGKDYLHVINFDRHQKFDRRGGSKLPPPPKCPPNPAESHRITLAEGKGKEGKGSGRERKGKENTNVKSVAAARRPKANGNGEAKPDTGPTWAAYREAYLKRYRQEPPPNAEDNSHMLAFVKKIPLEDSPGVAAFYVRHDKSWYVGKLHAVKYLREDAVGLHTQWRNRSQVTDTEARQADRTQATGNAFAPLIAEAEEEERKIANGRK